MDYISQNQKIKIWTDISKVDKNALEQIELMSTHPNLFSHIAIMPDVHLGVGAVIGSVVPLVNVIVPNIVGVDIGCGMSAINTNIKLTPEMDKKFWRNWKSKVDRKIPVGFNKHKIFQDISNLNINLKANIDKSFADRSVKLQIGTLGGGNHFLEAQVDEDNNIWLMVHSGSRHLGKTLAEYYNNLAKNFDQQHNLVFPKDLNTLLLDTKEGQDYFNDMKIAIDFALENRWRILENIYFALLENLSIYNINFEKLNVREKGINIHHNFANLETHFNQQVVVHRKGATQAYNGQLGIIPGSMGTKSYIVKGKSNQNSFSSCSHGAGRTMSRNQARKIINPAEFQESLKETYTSPSGNFIDEAPKAYKDINNVMKDQLELVDIIAILKPIITIKG